MAETTKIEIDFGSVVEAQKSVEQLDERLASFTDHSKQANAEAEKMANGVKRMSDEVKRLNPDHSKMIADVDEIKGKLSGATSGVDGFSDALGAVRQYAAANPFALLAAGVGLATTGLLAFAKAQGDALDQMSDSARIVGANATQFMIYDEKLSASGVSLNTYLNAQDKVSKALTKADEEGSKAAVALSDLGINAGETATSQSVLNEITSKYAERLAEGNLTATETAALQLVLGKSYRETIFAVEEAQGAQQIYNDLLQSGIGITQDAIDRAAENADANDELGFVMKSAASIIAADVLPSLTALTSQFTESYKNGGLVRVMFDGLRVVIDALLIPVKVFVATIIGADTAITVFGKSLGAVFAAIATRSTKPFDDLKNDIDSITAKAAESIRKLTEFRSDAEKINVSGNNMAPAAGGVGTSSGTEETKKHKERVDKAQQYIVELQKAVQREQDITFLVEAQTKISSGQLGIVTETQRQKILLLAAEKDILALKKQQAQEDQQAAENLRNLLVQYAAFDNTDRKKVFQKQRDEINDNGNLDEPTRRAAIADVDKKERESAIDMKPVIEANKKAQDAAEKYRNLLDPMRVLNNEIKSINENTFLSEDEKIDAIHRVSEEYVKSQQTMSEASKQTASLSERAFDSMATSLTRMALSGEFSIKSLASTFISSLTEMYLKEMVIAPAMQALKTMMFAANGAAFGTGGVKFFADGGVVNSPTAFAYSGGLGVMGEAGPEAIMPLRRDATGKLGVTAEGMGGMSQNIYITVTGTDKPESNANEIMRALSPYIDQRADARIVNAKRSGGLLNR